MITSIKTYVTDTTFWEDYFVSENKNVIKWAKQIISSYDSQIIVTPVVLTEFIRRLYYVHKKDPKKIRLAMKYMTHLFQNMIFPNISIQSVREIVKDLLNLPLEYPCHVGELSFLNIVSVPNTVTVSSDGGVLSAYLFTERLDPRQDPPTHLRSGETYTSG